MPSFMLLLHQSPSKFKDLSPEDIQKMVNRYIAWREDLLKRNKLRGGEKLTNDGGRHVRLQNDKVSVTDGPFSEVNEVLGGFFTIEAADYTAAIEIARTCPHLTGEQWIEIRQIEDLR
jgi:hypothetical protein